MICWSYLHCGFPCLCKVFTKRSVSIYKSIYSLHSAPLILLSHPPRTERFYLSCTEDSKQHQYTREISHGKNLELTLQKFSFKFIFKMIWNHLHLIIILHFVVCFFFCMCTEIIWTGYVWYRLFSSEYGTFGTHSFWQKQLDFALHWRNVKFLSRLSHQQQTDHELWDSVDCVCVTCQAANIHSNSFLLVQEYCIEHGNLITSFCGRYF